MDSKQTDVLPPAPAGTPVAQCLNCGTDLLGPYCHVCGQEGVDRNVTVRHLVHDFFGDVFSFDGRLLRTLRPLFLQPGVLPARYNAGHRVRYVPPMRLYVFMSFLLFLTITLINFDTTGLFMQTGDGPLPSASTPPASPTLPDSMRAAPEVSDALDSLDVVIGGRPAGDTPIGQLFKDRARRISRDPDAFQRQLASRISAMLFLLVPLFAFELKLLYLRRRLLYVRHLVFALYLHAFVFGFAALVLAGKAVFAPLTYAIWLIPVYLLLALRHAYGQGWARTGVKMALLLILHGTSSFLVLMLYVLVQAVLF